MDLRRRRKATQQQPNAVVAAANTMTRGQLRALSSSHGAAQSWQEAGWEHFDICSELRFGCTWIGNALSRARLYAAYIEDSEDEPVAEEEGRPAEIVAAIGGGPAAQSQMLQRVGVHLSVPGESFVVTWTQGQPVTDSVPAEADAGATPAPGVQRWAWVCREELTEDNNGGVTVKLDGQDIALPDEHVIIRIWRPHPRRHWEADSPVRGLIPVLNELERLTAHVLAQVESRLAGAGLLLVPDNITFPVEDDDGTRLAQGATEFIKILGAAMVTPIQDRESASAVVPVIAQAPAEAIAAIKHLTFATELDAQTMALREAAIRRLALGLDMPPEVLLGLAAANHWSAWEISENAVTQHIEPMLGVIVDGLTEGYFRPALIAEGIADPERWVIAYDTSELVNRPNRGPDALLLYDRGELTGSALRREHGFSEADGLTASEARQRQLRDLLGHAGIDSETANRLLELMGLVVPGQLNTTGTPESPVQLPSARTTTPPALPPAQENSPPQRPEAAGMRRPGPQEVLALQVVAQYAASAALEYAGKRLLASERSFRSQFRDVPHHELHTRIPVSVAGPYRVGFMLDGAFRTFDQMPDLAPVRHVVEAHVTNLLLEGLPLIREQLYADIERELVS